METETMEIQAFIEHHKLTMKVEQIAQNYDMQNEMPKGSGHYLCRISQGSDELTAPYSVGPGITLNAWQGSKSFKAYMWRSAELSRDTQLKVFHVLSAGGKVIEQYRGAAKNICYEAARHYRPDFADVLDCLASDASSVYEGQSFADWAADFGYDEDSRQAERAYQACLNIMQKLTALLGRDGLTDLMENVERL